MRYRLFIIAKLVVLFGVIFPFGVFAETDNAKCSPVGYSIFTINGVFTNENEAKKNKDELKKRTPPSFNSQPLTVDYLHNPSHIAGLGDLVMSAYQKIFDNEAVEDYDLVEMLKDASEKVKTQKFLLVAHSQGNFYANSFYDTVVGKEGGVPAESIGVYSVATPAGRVAGGGKWLTSDTDKVIAGIVGRTPFKKIMAPNTSIKLAEGDDNMGHNFSGVYLKYRGADIVSDIQSSLGRLTENNIQKKESFCLAPPKLTLAHKAEGAILSVVDPAANTGKDAAVVLAVRARQAGKLLVKGVYSLTGLIAGAGASLLQEDEKPPIKTYSLLVAPEENINFADNSQPATLAVNKIKLAEESLNDMQKKILALQNQATVSSESNSIASLTAIETSQLKFAASISPGFGGGGDGVRAIISSSGSSSSGAEISFSSSASSSSNSSSSSSSPADLSADLSTEEVEEAGYSSSSSSTSSVESSSSSSISSSSSSSVSDITPPTISSFFISQCQNSLSSDGCLIAATTVFLSWASFSDDLDYFELTSNGTTSTTTATSTTLTLTDNSNNSFSLRAKDMAGNWSTATTQTVEISTMPVVINEVAWSGNSSAYSADEWIELYNRTGKTINLNNFVLYSQADLTPYISLSGVIASSGYFLLERTNDNTVSNITANQIYTGSLKNNPSAEALRLVYSLNNSTTTIDYVPICGSSWCGGSSNYYSMERYDPNIVGTNISNWGTNNAIIRNSQNAGGGSINGTPKARNSVNYLINKGQNVSSDLTLYASNSPYLINNSVQTFSASSTLTIEPGVVIKFYNDAGLSFSNGAKISAIGTSANPIIFTSFYDDAYGGDTNGDAISTSPSAGNWYGVRINSPGSQSIISHAVFRYGGKYYNGPWLDSRANLYIANSSANISDSVFEYSKVYGLKMIYSDSSIADSVFRNNNNVLDTTGYDSSLFAVGGSLSLARNNFTSNHKGAYFFNSPATLDSNTFTSNANEAVYSYGQPGYYANNSGSGNGIDAISLSGTIAQNGATTTLSANSLPYLLRGNVIVAASSTLAVNPGITIKGWNNLFTSYLSVYGNLIASGTNFSDIVFGSMYNSPAKGNWGGVILYPGSYSNISGATFEYANTAIAYNNSPINLSNVKFNENNLGLSTDLIFLASPISASNVIFTGNTATTSPSGLW